MISFWLATQHSLLSRGSLSVSTRCGQPIPSVGLQRRQKSLQVNLTFRSHSGILNVAGAVLLCLFVVFPNSATKTKPDCGLFRGPRPSIFHNVEVSRLKKVLSKLDEVVVLTHDENVSRWKWLLGCPLVYGIREAKGLEFQQCVLLVDFCGGLPLQTRCRNMLLERHCSAFKEKCPEV
jgi:hypothetical protein